MEFETPKIRRRPRFAKAFENLTEARKMSREQLRELAKTNPELHGQIIHTKTKMRGVVNNIIASGAAAAGNITAGMLPGAIMNKGNNSDQYSQNYSYGSSNGLSGGFGGAAINDANEAGIARSEGRRG